jgi:hypothetical protein
VHRLVVEHASLPVCFDDQLDGGLQLEELLIDNDPSVSAW